MELKQALTGMENAKKNLRSEQGVSLPAYMSKEMDRLATYTNAAEDHLADLEQLLEIKERQAYVAAIKDNSPSASEKIAKYEVAEIKGDIKRLKRLVDSSWRLIDEKRSRFNHLTKEIEGKT